MLAHVDLAILPHQRRSGTTNSCSLPCSTTAGGNRPFTNGQCMTVPGADPQSPFTRVTFNCTPTGTGAGEGGPQAGLPLLPMAATQAVISYSANADCSPGYSTSYRVTTGQCAMVSATASALVECYNDASGGLLTAYATPDCTGAAVPTAFNSNGECLPQPEGNPAISIRCYVPSSSTDDDEEEVEVQTTVTPTPAATTIKLPTKEVKGDSTSSAGPLTRPTFGSLAAGLVIAAALHR